ncbi:glycosyltransferase family 4 protein [Novacetimonas pomaceti]|uniref:glycosyltransferase family 4 protein n=1 Tax=Novacetimonas pomaceti TaxID=2021998 RepID=UPI001EF14B1E|nr:glycosyltransferase family 1 protein [Novacetimonas pomaceti]
MNGLSDPAMYRVGIDGFNLAIPKGTGIATYARTLSHVVKNLGHPVDVLYGMNISHKVSPEMREVMFFNILGSDGKAPRRKGKIPRWIRNQIASFGKNHPFEISLTGRVDQRGFLNRLPAFDRILNEQEIFARASRYFRTTGNFLSLRLPDTPRIMHWTYPLPIQVEGAINLYTIHDLVPLRFPQTTLDDKSYHFRLMKKICGLNAPICTVSEASRRDIAAFFPEMADRIYNPYQSFLPDPVFMKRSEEETREELEGVFGFEPESYFLFYGSLEPKKNIGRIIEGFLSSQTDRKLVIVGAMAWKNENELRFLQHGVDEGRIVLFDYLPQISLITLVRHARALLFPSLTEGFGLPALEAMFLGTPVLTSHEGGLPEVVENSAVMVRDAYDAASITDGISLLDQDDALYQRLKSEGPVQADKFSLTAYGERVKEMYAEITRRF